MKKIFTISSIILGLCIAQICTAASPNYLLLTPTDSFVPSTTQAYLSPLSPNWIISCKGIEGGCSGGGGSATGTPSYFPYYGASGSLGSSSTVQSSSTGAVVITQPLTPLGSNLVSQSNFSSDSDWTVGSGWTNGTNQENFTYPTSGAPLTATLVNAGTGYANGDVVGLDGGDGNAGIDINTVDGSGAITGWNLDGPGEEGVGYNVGSTYGVLYGSGMGATFTVDSISPASALTLSQTIAISNPYLYKVTATIGGSAGSLAIQLGSSGSSHTFAYNAGSVSFIDYTTGNTQNEIIITATSTFVGHITNVTVQQLPAQVFGTYDNNGNPLLYSGIDGVGIGTSTPQAQLSLTVPKNQFLFGAIALRNLVNLYIGSSTVDCFDIYGHLEIGGCGDFSNAEVAIKSAGSANFIFDGTSNNNFYYSDPGFSIQPSASTPVTNVYGQGGTINLDAQNTGFTQGGSVNSAAGGANSSGYPGSANQYGGGGPLSGGNVDSYGGGGGAFGGNVLAKPGANSQNATGTPNTFAINNAGSGYVLGDEVALSGGNDDAYFIVTGISSGQVTAIDPASAGTDYVAATDASTTYGTGSGLTIDYTIADDKEGQFVIEDADTRNQVGFDTSEVTANRTIIVPDATDTLLALNGSALWNATGTSLGINTSTPATALDVNGDITDEKAAPHYGTGASTAIACYTSTGKLGYITIANLLTSGNCNSL
jgi:hypothetical protein